ncbi:MAG: hypothetical protein DRP65_00580 [Planctomycetota bacterium]|nr:MAG: hypothetical protein DRP65_00580 [Planctomycetota bacterium]
MDFNEEGISRIATVGSVDLNSVASTNLFTVPDGKKLLVDSLVLRNLSADAANAVAQAGQSGDKDDFCGPKTLSNLSAAGKATELRPVLGRLTGSDTWDPGSIADGGEEAKEVTVTGAALGDFARASFSNDVSDLVLDAQVTAANTVTCILANNTGGAIDLASGTIKVEVFNLDRPAAIVEYAGGTVFVIDVTTAAGSACTCSVDLMGRLVDA